MLKHGSLKYIGPENIQQIVKLAFERHIDISGINFRRLVRWDTPRDHLNFTIVFLVNIKLIISET